MKNAVRRKEREEYQAKRDQERRARPAEGGRERRSRSRDADRRGKALLVSRREVELRRDGSAGSIAVSKQGGQVGPETRTLQVRGLFMLVWGYHVHVGLGDHVAEEYHVGLGDHVGLGVSMYHLAEEYHVHVGLGDHDQLRSSMGIIMIVGGRRLCWPHTSRFGREGSEVVLVGLLCRLF